MSTTMETQAEQNDRWTKNRENFSSGLMIASVLISAFCLYAFSDIVASHYYGWFVAAIAVNWLLALWVIKGNHGSVKKIVKCSKKRGLILYFLLSPAVISQVAGLMATGETPVKITALGGVNLGETFAATDEWLPTSEVQHNWRIHTPSEYDYVKPDPQRPKSMIYVALVDGMVYKVSLYFVGDTGLDPSERQEEFDNILSAKYGDKRWEESDKGWFDGKNAITYGSDGIHAFDPMLNSKLRDRDINEDHRQFDRIMNTYIGTLTP